MVPKPFSFETNQEPIAQPAVIVVTPYSSGCCIAQEIQKRGYKIICLWNAGLAEEMKSHVPKIANELQYDIELDEEMNASIEETAKMVHEIANQHSMEIIACICGGEAGLELADALSEHMGLLSNGTSVGNRRDKKVQQNLVKKSGLRSIREISGTSFTKEVDEFLQKESYPVIIKPLDSAGSDGVKKCVTYEEAKEHYLYLLNDHEMVNGGGCDEVLCQEYLCGKEYVVDTVSRNGVHKVTMIMQYQKEPANDGDFVYFGELPIDTNSKEGQVLIPYAKGVLDALGCKHGPSHGEFIITHDNDKDDGNMSPCLVEMNCRVHGGDGIWIPLCEALCGGYSQIDATADAYLDKDRFDALPDVPPCPFKSNGQVVEMVSYQEGILKSIPGFEVIKLLPSFVGIETHLKPGLKVEKTVDLMSEAGTAVLIHKDKDVLARDYQLIRNMEQACALFEVADEEDEDTTMKDVDAKREAIVKSQTKSKASTVSTMENQTLLQPVAADNFDMYVTTMP